MSPLEFVALVDRANRPRRRKRGEAPDVPTAWVVHASSDHHDGTGEFLIKNKLYPYCLLKVVFDRNWKKKPQNSIFLLQLPAQEKDGQVGPLLGGQHATVDRSAKFRAIRPGPLVRKLREWFAHGAVHGPEYEAVALKIYEGQKARDALRATYLNLMKTLPGMKPEKTWRGNGTALYHSVKHPSLQAELLFTSSDMRLSLQLHIPANGTAAFQRIMRTIIEAPELDAGYVEDKDDE